MKVYDRLDRQYEMYADEYKQAAIRVLDRAWYILGAEGETFEKEFAAMIGSPYCVGLNSGLDALTLGMRALGLGEGDEVLVPANTFVASVIGISENRATPVFVEPDVYYNLDAARLESALTPRTKAVLAVHLYGQACNMQMIRAFCDKHQLWLIEDCAQAHGAAFEGRNIGTWGDVGCFSFYPTKNLGAFGDAGAITTARVDIAEKMRMLRNYGSKVKYHNEIVGVNSRLDEMQAALLRVKLSHFPELLAQKRGYAKRYLAGIHNDALLLPQVREGATSVWHQFVIRCETREDLMRYLEEREIKTLIHYPIPPHLQQCYAGLGYHEGDFPVAEAYAKTVLSLPIYNGITDDEQQYVIDALNAYRR